jgi:hypothetical protein
MRISRSSWQDGLAYMQTFQDTSIGDSAMHSGLLDRHVDINQLVLYPLSRGLLNPVGFLLSIRLKPHWVGMYRCSGRLSICMQFIISIHRAHTI